MTPPSRLQNARDLGGLRTAQGRTVAFGRVYRSDAPLQGDEPPTLAGWPPRTVIDLRAPDERAGTAHPLASPSTEIVTVSLLRAAAPAAVAADKVMAETGLSSIYRELIADPTQLVEVVRRVAACPSPTLVHCTAGKDRTGAAIAVTLGAVGVDRATVVSDYLITQHNMPGVLTRIIASAPEPKQRARIERLARTSPALFDAPRAAIEIVLDALDEAGGARRWLLDHGLGQHELDALSAQLLEPGRSG